MSTRVKVTVIVPVHNNEDTVCRCLESIRTQSYEDFEAIVIDDGSADASGRLASEFCDKDNRFRFFAFSENKGVSAARNCGLENANGEYVTFADADDTLPKDSLKHMHQATVIYEADTVCGIYERVDGVTSYKNTRSYHLANKTRRIAPDDLDLVHSWSVWNKWFSNALITKHGLRFENYAHLEDAVFLYTYLQHAKNIYACPHLVYTYRKPLPDEGRTTTQCPRPQMLDDANKAFERIGELARGYGKGFATELVYRFLLTPLIGDYYRRLWKLGDGFAQKLADELDALFNRLDGEHQERVLAAQSDILTEAGFKTKEDLLAHPQITVIVSAGVGAKAAPVLLDGLYDQPAISFRVLVAEELRDSVPDWVAAMPNFDFFQGEPVALFDEFATPFVSLLESPVMYDQRSLRTMLKSLERNPDLPCVELGVVRRDGSEASLPEGDCSNGVFRTEELAARKARDDGEGQNDKPKRLKRPVLISLSEPEEVQESQSSQGRASRPRLMRRLARMARKAFAKSSKGEAAAPAKETRIPTSEFYLNLDIDPKLIVIEALGKQPRGNSLYILQELQKPAYQGFKIVFSVLDSTRDYAEAVFEERGFTNAHCVLAGSDEYKRALFSAHILFNEVDFPNWWIKKPRQVYVNIWHGTPLKKLAHAKNETVHLDAQASRNFTMADYVLCANEYSIEHILGDCGVLGITHAKVLMLGYPRTAQLFDESMSAQVRTRYDLQGKRVIAWMPTYRDFMTAQFANSFLREVESLLGPDEIIYVNLHHKTAAAVDYEGLDRVRPFPKELDTYEFLCGVDVLVTDYSSIMFDFAATHRKIVLYCPDQKSYEQERGLYRSIEDLPFPSVSNAQELLDESRDENVRDARAFYTEFNSYDSPQNTENLCRASILGDLRGIEIRDLGARAEHPTFIVSDALEPGPATDFLYELAETGVFGKDMYLSFTEHGVSQNLESAYPLVQEVPLYATKGKPLSERTEEIRLYNNLNPKAVIVLDTASVKRIRCFARFEAPTYLFIQPELAHKVQSDPKALKALKLFAKWGNGVFAMSEAIADEMSQLLNTTVDVVDTKKAFTERFL
jgi:CDP-glycerol glycerophosphotransferase (TagB/SpsB family)/glycosyltransferase involved in cell wall biosynthesis